jgi:Golgi SNAP receptor complex protein 2
MLSELLPEEKRRLHEIEQQLIELERGNTTIQASDVYIGLQEMNVRLVDLEKLLQRESKSKKDDFRRRLQHLRASHSHVRDSLENYVKRTGANDYNLQKAKLLASSAAHLSQQDLELEMAENGSLMRSSKMIGEYLSLGQETLGELVNQRERLKSIQRKAFDMLNYLGISNTLLKHIEKRDGADKWIVYGGMVLIMLLLVCIWWFLRR